jgi:hypothetical protein
MLFIDSTSARVAHPLEVAVITRFDAHEGYLIYNKGAVSDRKCDAMTTVDLNVKLQLSEDVERKAREAGLFTGEKIGELIEAEVQRQRKEAWERLQAKLAPVHAAFQEEYGHLSDDEVQAMIDQWIDEADAAPDERSS